MCGTKSGNYQQKHFHLTNHILLETKIFAKIIAQTTMDAYTSDSSDTDSRDLKTLDYGRMNMDNITLECHEIESVFSKKNTILTNNNNNLNNNSNNNNNNGFIIREKDVETLLLNHNEIIQLPMKLLHFVNLKVLDLSNNSLRVLPESLSELPLVTLVVKNNSLTNKSLPKSFLNKSTTTSCLKELNLSGNAFTMFPEQLVELRHLKYLYIGGNKIETLTKDIWKMQNLQVLSLGGNRLNEVPDTVGLLSQLQALVLCDNHIENLPTTIAHLKNLKSLLLHKNRLKHLPKDIVALKNLTELSLRDNPLVVRFVQDIALHPPTLLELAARIVKTESVGFAYGDVPTTLLDYLTTANCCVNPKCQGVFFDNRVEHIKFVDFCGMYRVPLLQYLCSSKCIEPEPSVASTSRASSGYMMRKVLLG